MLFLCFVGEYRIKISYIWLKFLLNIYLLKKKVLKQHIELENANRLALPGN
jgi:hypothetical protein